MKLLPGLRTFYSKLAIRWGHEGTLNEPDLLYFAAPPAGRPVGRFLDELLEAFEVRFHLVRNKPDGLAGVLHQTLWVGLQLQHHPGLGVCQAMKCHHAAVSGAVDALPRDPLVGRLFSDLGVELPRDASDADLPVGPRQMTRCTRSTPSMKLGKDSNWVHWSYATRTGTATSIDVSVSACALFWLVGPVGPS